MNHLRVMHRFPVVSWLILLATLLVALGLWAISTRINEVALAVDEIARDDATAVAHATGRSLGYELTIAVADGTRLLQHPGILSGDPDQCRAALEPLSTSVPVTIVVFRNGTLHCSLDTRPDPNSRIPWITQWWSQTAARGVFEIHGAGNVGSGTITRAPDGNLAIAIPAGDYGLVAIDATDHRLARHLNTLGDRAVALGLVDRNGTILTLRTHRGPLQVDTRTFDQADGGLRKGPGGLTGRWAEGEYGQRFGSALVAINSTTTQNHLTLFRQRSQLIAGIVGTFGLLGAVTIVRWGSRSLRRATHLIQAAAEGGPIDFQPSRLTPSEITCLIGRLHTFSERRRQKQLDAELTRQQEAARLGLELHDDIIQRIAAVSMIGASNQQLAIESLSSTVNRLRHLSSDLSPTILTQQGLAEAIQAHTAADQTTVVEDRTRGQRFAPMLERTLYRNVLEAVRNAQTHGHPRSIHVTIDTDGDHLTVIVDDDGGGIDPAMCDGRPGHLGITSMRSLTEQLGGTFTITPINGGTRVTFTCPTRIHPADSHTVYTPQTPQAAASGTLTTTSTP